jgi:hybrid cluster-associated redox disulfide protein
MGAGRFLGSFVQATFFGGTYEDLAFEVRVLKGEIARLHERLDKETTALRERIDVLEGKTPKGKGRGRLSILGSADAEDARGDRQDAAPTPPTNSVPPASTATRAAPAAIGLEAVGDRPAFDPAMTIRAAWLARASSPPVFARHHLPGCVDCAMSHTETLAEGAALHGIDVDALIADLRAAAEH